MSMRFLHSAVLILILVLVAGAVPPRGARAGTRDGEWSLRFQPMGMSSNLGGPRVKCMIAYGGFVAVGGYFNEIGGLETNHVAVWNNLFWQALGSGLDWEPNALYHHGSLVVGGDFHSVDGHDYEYVAQWSGSEQRWYSMGDLVEPPNAFCEHVDLLYVGGDFYGDCSLAHWAGLDWDYLTGVGVDWGTVRAIEYFDGSIYLGGSFDAHFAQNLLGWTLDDSFRPHILDGNVYCLLRKDNYLYVGGTFEHADGVASHGLAQLWIGGGFQPVDDLGTDCRVWSMTEYLNALHVATDYEVRSYTVDGWSEPYGGSFADRLFSVCAVGDNLFAGGDFPGHIARWDDGEWVHLGGGLDRTGDLRCLVLYDGDVVAGGSYVHLPAMMQSEGHCWNVMRWDGDAWHRLGEGLNNDVQALAVFQGDLYAGGAFSGSGSESIPKIARWDGESWQGVGGASGTVMALHEYDGELVAGGHFTTTDGVAAGHVACWDGAQWRILGAGTDAAVRALTVYRGELIAAGDFAAAGGAPAAHVARWDGESWQPLGAGLDGTVRSLTVWHDQLIAGGHFDFAGGAPAVNVARWDGDSWHALGGGVSGESLFWGVTALLGSTDLLYVGGDFDTAGGATARGLACWDGATWSELGGGVRDGYASTQVNAFLVKDGNLYLGGDFGSLRNSIAASKMALWLDGTITPVMLQWFRAQLAADAGAGPAVDLSWRTALSAEPADFRLAARAGTDTWPVICAANGPGAFTAHDASPYLAAARDVVYSLDHRDPDTGWQTIGEQTVTLTTPVHSRLVAVQPNPFNPRGEFAFELARPGAVCVEVYALTGRRVATPLQASLPAGRHTGVWDGCDAQGREVASGTYLLRMVTDERVDTIKAVLVR